jgi:cytochrome c553
MMMQKAFDSKIPVEPRLNAPFVDDGVAVALGEKLYNAQCVACHGAKGWGDNPMFPRLKGQPYQYTINQVKSFASGHRTGGNSVMMKGIAQNLSEHDLYNVALYLENADMDIATLLKPIEGFKLPGTGQLQDTTDTFGESSDYPGNGIDLVAKGDIVIDNNTKLMWEADNAGGMRMSEAQQYCGSLEKGGYSDWRIPSIKELQTIILYRNSKPATNTNLFSGIPVMGPAGFWAGPVLQVDNNTNTGWHIGFPDGHVMLYSADGYKNVFCVRSEGGQYLMPQLTDNADGTVTDAQTSLTWQQQTAPKMPWEAGLNYCENLDLAGRKWRMPNFKELISVADYTRMTPSIDAEMFPETNTDSFYWTSTSDVIPGATKIGELFMGNPERNESLTDVFKIENGLAWGVSFDEGGAWRYPKSGEYHVRCVAD